MNAQNAFVEEPLERSVYSHFLRDGCLNMVVLLAMVLKGLGAETRGPLSRYGIAIWTGGFMRLQHTRPKCERLQC